MDMDHPRTVYFISLGCAKNLVDSENMAGILRADGFTVVQDMESASDVVINTCGFLQAAVEEAVDTILEAVALKKAGGIQRVFVVGCFVQRYGYKLGRGIPEVDGWLGTGEIHRIGEAIRFHDATNPFFHLNRPGYLADHETPRALSTPFYTAYLKIAEGCPHRCTYCTIPNLRGPLRSRTPDSVLREARSLVAGGVIELNLIAQDTTSYGMDLCEETGLEDLLVRLVQIKDLAWLRVLYSHPLRVSDRLLEILDKEETVCPYLDIPLQHVDDNLLKAMGREPGTEKPRDLIERVRSLSRQISLRTSLIIGFPGETAGQFERLYDFVAWAGFDHLGAFLYSPEKGTPAARYGNEVPRDLAEDRLDRIMRLQARISKEKHDKMKGKTLPVLIEGLFEETDLLLQGRTATMAPDVDGRVLINKGEGRIGRIMPVRITEAHPYDLIGEIRSC
jgi:ribosomal protein S12 methylthiotransferase